MAEPVTVPFVLATWVVIDQLADAGAAQDGEIVTVNDHDWPAPSVTFGDSVVPEPELVPAGLGLIDQPLGGVGIVTDRRTSDVAWRPERAVTVQVKARLIPRATWSGLAGEQAMRMSSVSRGAMPAVIAIVPRGTVQADPRHV
jgi:hypothetical protein